MKLSALAASIGVCLMLSSAKQTSELRVGIIGTDTSHVTAFTKLLNDKNDPAHVPGARVVAAFKGGSPDVEAGRTRVDKFAAELKDTPIKVNAADPGYTATDLNDHSGPQTVAEGAEAAVRLATLPTEGPTGGYFNKDYEVPW